MDWPLRGMISQVKVYPSYNLAASVAAHASANTKGAYTELCAALPWDALISLYAMHGALNNRDFLIDLAIGAAGSEQIIVPNIYYTQMAYYYFPILFPLKVFVPSGTRISARCQATTGGQPVFCHIHAERFTACGGDIPPQYAVNYGAVTADSGGTGIDPGATPGTYGAWVELTASSVALRGFLFQVGTQRNAARSTYTYAIDIGVGAAGSEQAICEELPRWTYNGHNFLNPQIEGPFMIPIPAGTRIAVRGICTGTDATDRLFDAMIIGLI
jgi:hypothetical protein